MIIQNIFSLKYTKAYDVTCTLTEMHILNGTQLYLNKLNVYHCELR